MHFTEFKNVIIQLQRRKDLVVFMKQREGEREKCQSYNKMSLIYLLHV